MSDDTKAHPESGRDKLEISNMFLCGSTFTAVSFKDAEFRDTHLMNALVDDVNATGMRFNNVNLSDAQFREINMSGVSIKFANLTGLSISEVNYTDMTIEGIKVTDMLALWKETNGDQD